MTTRQLTLGGFTVVVAVAAAISYDHIRLTAGAHWWAWFIPLSIDGLMVAGSAVLWMQRRDGHRGSTLAWAAVVSGLGMSLWANAAQADPSAIGLALAIWPALALAIGFELLIIASRPEPVSKTRSTPKPWTEARDTSPRASVQAPAPPTPTPTPTPIRSASSSMSSRVRDWIRAELDAGREPSAADANAAFDLTGTSRCGARELRKVLAERERTA